MSMEVYMIAMQPRHVHSYEWNHVYSMYVCTHKEEEEMSVYVS